MDSSSTVSKINNLSFILRQTISLLKCAINSPLLIMTAVTTQLGLSLSNIRNTLFGWVKWVPTSPQELDLAESQILSHLERPFTKHYVDIGEGFGMNGTNKIWTLQMVSHLEQRGLPLVMLHGLASGIGFWVLNLDSISKTNRKVYAIDILGMGKSSRPKFDKETCELELVESIERWRSKVGLNEKFILLGHSFGGYLALSYALHYPDKVAHLILADPWGIPSQQQAQQLQTNQYPKPIWVKMVANIMSRFSLLAGLRAAGPWGPKLVDKVRPDLKKKFEKVTGTAETSDHSDCMLRYIYHCNAQSPPSGELAFKAIALPYGWARYPMINRVVNLNSSITMTFIYGSKSWVDRQPGFQIKYLLGERVNVHVMRGSGHHVYADKPEEFNELISRTCYYADDKYRGHHEDFSEGEIDVPSDETQND